MAHVRDWLGNDVDFTSAESYMDCEIIEEMTREGYDSDIDAQAFFDEYARRHAQRFDGEEFAPYYGLAW